MALTIATRHWLTGIALGCAFIAASLLPPSEREPRSGEPRRGPASDVERIDLALRRANDRLALLEHRDSLQRVLAGRALDPEQPTLLFGAIVPAEVRSAIADAVAAQWRFIAPSSGIPVAVVVTADTTGPRSAVPDINHILPAAFDGKTCVTTVRFKGVSDGGMMARRINSSSSGWVTTSRMLGPCGYYAAFGQPGPEVARWLSGMRYAAARGLDWRSTAAIRRGETRSPLRPYFGTMFYDMVYNADVRALACVTGRLEQCEAIVLDTTGFLPEQRWSRDLVASGSYSRWSSAFTPLGDFGGWYVSDMVHGLGKERFARFWTSSQPVPRAFAEASGVSLAEWTRRWLTVDNVADRLGTSPAPRTFGMSLIVVLAGTLVSMAVVQRRRAA